MDTNKMTALYARNGLADPEEIRKQLVLTEGYAMLNNLDKDIRYFTDDGFSGLDFDRPGLQELRDAIRADEVQTVIVKNLARLARNMLHFNELLDEMKEHGVRFIAIKDDIDVKPEPPMQRNKSVRRPNRPAALKVW